MNLIRWAMCQKTALALNWRSTPEKSCVQLSFRGACLFRYCSTWTDTYNELPSSLSGGMLTMWITLWKGRQTRRRKTGRVHFLRNAFSVGSTSSRYWTKKSFRAIRTRARVLLGNVQILGAICQYLFRTGSLRVQKMPELLKNKSLLLDGQVIAQFCLWYIISNMTRKKGSW